MKLSFLVASVGLLPLTGFSQSYPCYDPLFLDLNQPCLTIYTPVCGCDGITYGNECEALYHHGVTAFVPGECDQVTGPCNATAAEAARFHFDAKTQAFRRQVKGLGDSVTVDIPDSLYQRVLKSFLSIYQLTGVPARDEVFTYMTSFYTGTLYTSPKRIYVNVDTAETWGKNFQNGVFPTGDPVVDDLIVNYQLRAKFFYVYLNNRTLIVNSPFAVNTVALVKAFNGAAGLLFAETTSGIGDGDRTEIQSWDNPMVIDFSYGWGDCPAGCIWRHYWRFSVDDMCQATFIQSWGDPLPPVATAEPSVVKAFDVLGLPGGPFIHLKVVLTKDVPFDVRVWNILGQLEQQHHFPAGVLDKTLDWGEAAPGVYFVELSAGGVQMVRKVMR